MVSVQLGEAFVTIRASLGQLDRDIALASERIRSNLADGTAQEFARMSRQIRRSLDDVGDQLGRTAIEGRAAMGALRDAGVDAVNDIARAMVGAGLSRLGETFLPQGGGAISGILSGILNGVLAGLFGGGSRRLPDIPFLAEGGRLLAGQTAVVGEQGPEFFTAGISGQVSPIGAGAIAVQQTFNISTGVAQTVRTELISLLPQLADTVKASLADEVQRGGAFASVLRG